MTIPDSGIVWKPVRWNVGIIIVSIGLFFISMSLAKDDEGLAHYKNNNFDSARNYYESVLQKNDDNAAANYGLGAAAFQQGDYSQAIDAFNRSLDSEDPVLRSKAFYNMGNTLYQQQRPEESLAYYKKALELNPDDSDSKYNYELLKYQMQQQPQQQNNGDSKQNQEKTDQQTGEQEQNQDQNQQEQKQNEKQNQQQEEQQESQPNEQQKESQPKQNQEQSNKSTRPSAGEKEEPVDQEKVNAEAILDALKDNEKILQKRQIARASSRKLEKDW